MGLTPEGIEMPFSQLRGYLSDYESRWRWGFFLNISSQREYMKAGKDGDPR